MSVLNKSIHKITFEDIVEICSDGTMESAVLDYKESVPKDLSKHFAAFSNTYGGLIIIGVEEDSKTGKPLKYEGIKLESKDVDRIHQFAANVTPLPHYEVTETNEVNGKVFLLVRIYQGDLSPYVSNSDLSIKIRTGNVTTPLRSVESHELNRLFERREKATSLREDALSFSTDILLKAMSDAKDKIEEEQPSIMGIVLPAVPVFKLEAPFYRITIIPQSPGQPIIDYRDTLTKMSAYRFSNGALGTFPGLNENVVPGGLYSFRYGSNHKFEYGLINENGLIDLVEDITRINSGDGKDTISIMIMVNHLVRQLKVARKFYDLAGYNGLLNIDVQFECQGALVPYPIIDGGSYWPDDNMVSVQSHHWTISDFDTVTLGDDTLLVPKLIELINRIYWHFGFSDDDSELIERYLAKLGIAVSESVTVQ